MKLFAERGFSNTSTRRVAREAGVSEGLIFHHFPTKLDLLRGALEGRQLLANAIRQHLEGAELVPARQVIRAIGASFTTLFRADRVEARLFRVLLSEGSTNPVLYEAFKITSADVIATLAAYLRARVHAGELRSELPAEAAARSLLGAFLWFLLTTQHLCDEAWRQQSATYVDEVIDLWLRGALAADQPGEI